MRLAPLPRVVAWLPLACALAACTVGPDYTPPKPAMPTAFASAAPAASGTTELAHWWTGFGDPTLDGLVVRALHDNLDVQSAASRIRAARQQEIIAGAAFWPTLTADPQVTHTTLSRNAISLSGLGGLTGGPPSTANTGTSFGLPGNSFSTYQLGVSASWELDLFGRTRRTVEAARDTTAASVWDARDTQVALISEIADAYFALRVAQVRLDIARRDLTRQRDLLDLVRARARSGLASDLDVRQQQTVVAATESGLSPLTAELAVQRHALDVLLGAAPETALELPPSAALPAAPVVPIGLPADLLRRRPDIRAAERQLAAATANIGVAVADYYPDITLTAAPALVSTALSNLLTWGSRNLTAGASASWSLFDGGKVKANVAVMDERARQALLAYRKTVLTALQEVEDALTRCAADRARQRIEAVQTARARDAADLARVQYRAGLVPLSTVLTTEAALLNAEDGAAQTDSASAQDLVALYTALGGGWDDAALPRVAAE